MRRVIALICLSATLALAQTKPLESKSAETAPAKQTAAPESYPVWWDPELMLDKLSDADAMLSKPFSEDDLKYLRENANRVSSGQHQPDVHNCKELLAVVNPDDYSSFKRTDWWGIIGVKCAEMRELDHVVPAQQSAVRSNKWTNKIFSQLPAGIAYADDEKEHHDVVRAGKKNLSLLQYWKIKIGHDIEIDDQVISLGPDNEVNDSYTVVARGDFTGDGWEDLLIQLEGGFSHTSPASYAAFIITRKSETERFKIVKIVF
jgi:hypothetical protein